MDSVMEAFLMLGIEALSEQLRTELNESNWRLCGLLIHAYNLRKGMVCTGFDEDDPDLDEEH